MKPSDMLVAAIIGLAAGAIAGTAVVLVSRKAEPPSLPKPRPRWNDREICRLDKEVAALQARAAIADFPQYGVFATMFVRGRYLSFLNLRDASHEVELVRRRVHVGDPQSAIRAMLGQPNWRQHLVACVAVLHLEDAGPVLEDLWAAFDRPSWVTPQLAVTLFMVDPSFADQATRRLQNPAINQKAANALLALLPAGSVLPARQDLDLDRDKGGEVARRWKSRILPLVRPT